MEYGVNAALTHDRFVRRCLGDIELAKHFFRRFLTPQQQQDIDLDDLKPGGKDTFVGKDLNAMTTDLLFQAPIHNHQGFLSLLVEHKSEGAVRGTGHILPFQVRSQEVMIMDYGRRNHPKKRYPLVYMVGLYHGTRKYAGPRSASEHIDAPARMIPDRWKENIELIDLAAYSDEELIANGKLGVFLLVLKYVYATDMPQTLEDMAPRLQSIQQQQGDDFIYTVFQYLLEATRVEKHDEMIHIAKKAFSKEVGDRMISIADHLRQEGRQEGEEKKSKEIAQILLADNQPLEYIKKVTNLTIDQIKALANQDGNLGST